MWEEDRKKTHHRRRPPLFWHFWVRLTKDSFALSDKTIVTLDTLQFDHVLEMGWTNPKWQFST